MNVRATTLSKWGSPLHYKPDGSSRIAEGNNNGTYWRSDSINIYHNHKVKLFRNRSPAIRLVEPFGVGVILLVRVFGPQNKSKTRLRQISLQFPNSPVPNSQFQQTLWYQQRSLRVRRPLNPYSLVDGTIHTYMAYIWANSDRAGMIWVLGTVDSLIGRACTDLSRSPWTLDRVYLRSGSINGLLIRKNFVYGSLCLDSRSFFISGDAGHVSPSPWTEKWGKW